MHVEQKHVWSINLRDGSSRDIVLRKDGWGYQLSLIASEDIVHIQLTTQDLQRLCKELRLLDGVDVRAETSHGASSLTAAFHAAEPAAVPRTSQWSTLDWITFN